MMQKEPTLASKLFQNRGLFSDHFLQERLPEWKEWNVIEKLEQFRNDLLTLYEAKKQIMPGLNEAQTEEEFIKPVLDLLGYANSYIVQASTKIGQQTNRPDYALFPNASTKDKAYAKIESNDYTQCIGIADAKYWGRELDLAKTNERDTYKNQNPSFQIAGYLNGTKQNWGILTNGRFWRLYSTKSHLPLGNYYQVDLVQLLEAPAEALKYFFIFFRKEALLRVDGKSFLDRVLEGSEEYAVELEADIKDRAYDVVELLCRGFAAAVVTEKLNDNVLKSIYDNSLTLLYRLLFVFYAEARDLLPLTKSASYRDNYSLRKMAHDIDEIFKKGYELSSGSTQYYHYLKTLFALINEGDPDLEVPEYNGGLFDLQEHPFLEDHAIPDSHLVNAIHQLARIYDREIKREVAVDYNTLSERHLGSIYEGLLEFRPQIALHDLVVIKEKGSVKYAPASKQPGKKVSHHKGDLYLVNDKGERKASGSYYTPEYIVNYIVENTLDPLVKEAQEKVKTLKPEVNKEIAKWQKLKEQKTGLEPTEKYDRAVSDEREKLLAPYLSIKVLDPAMGSGHFLARATDFLAEAIATDPCIESPLELTEESELTYYRRRVVESCIYGVDLNPLAVELAKLTLWLTTMAKSKPLSFLNHHLRVGNSLIGARIADLDEIPKVKSRKKAIDLSRAPVQLGLFQVVFNQKLYDLLQNRALIAKLPTETLGDVHNKQKWEEAFEHNVERFRMLADVWTSMFFGNDVAWDGYNTLVEKLQSPDPEWEKLTQKKYVQKALVSSKEKRFFHWELEFPEVFYDEQGNRKADAGFNAVIGNPPYVLEARENAELFRELKRHPMLANYYEKNIDIFCFFSDIALDLLAQRGIHSYIVPIYWVDRTGCTKMRRKIFNESTLELLVDFNDYPVFEDASGHHSSIYMIAKKPSDERLQRYIEIELDSSLSRGARETSAIAQLKSKEIPAAFYLSNDKLLINPVGQADLIKFLEELPHFHLSKKSIMRGVDTLPSDYEGHGVFVLSEEEYKNMWPTLNSQEIEFLKPFYLANQIDAYYYEPKNYSCLIYTDRERKQKLISQPEKYPQLINHLAQYSDIITSDNKPYGLHRPKDEQSFLSKNKLVFVRKTAYPRFAFSSTPFFCDESVYLIMPETEHYSLNYLLSVFNSKIFYWWCSRHKTHGSQLQIDKEIILGTPIRCVSFNTQQNERLEYLQEAKKLYQEYLVSRDSDKILAFVSDFLPLKEDGTPDTEHEHSDVVHDLLAFLAEEMTRLNKEKQSKIKVFLSWLEKEVIKGSIEDQKNKTRIKSFHEGTLDELMDVLKKNRVVPDPCPSNIRDTIASEFSAAVNALIPLKARIKTTDDLIDKIIYKLYGLTGAEIAVVEGDKHRN